MIPGTHFVKGDICDADAVATAIKKYDIDTIVNFAAETHVDRSILNPDAFIQTSVYGTYVLLEATRKLRSWNVSTRFPRTRSMVIFQPATQAKRVIKSIPAALMRPAKQVPI